MRMFLLQLGIYDDDDVAPTLVFGYWAPSPEIESLVGGAWNRAAAHEMRAVAKEMKTAARKEYGRRFAPHAMFWSCEERDLGEPLDAPSS